MTATLSPAATQADGSIEQAKVSTEFRMFWRNQIMQDHGLPLMEADAIISDTLSFLTVCAMNPCNKFRPSKKVDIGWHQFILNTREYAEFCDRVAGRFLHHVPERNAAPSGEGTAIADALRPTVDAIEAARLPIHPELWFAEAGKCTQCHSGCTSCGQEDQP